jgi:AcrR family transcriptional regulator
MRLFAKQGFDDVTVGDIAAAAHMTPAAVYYHFAGKEQILLEGTRTFGVELVDAARQTVAAGASPAELLVGLLEHVRRRQTFATVYFVNSAGLNPLVEAQRKTVRAVLGEVFTDAARSARRKLSAAEAGVIGASLVSLLEVSASSVLSRDQTSKMLGAAGVSATVADLAERIVGIRPG